MPEIESVPGGAVVVTGRGITLMQLHTFRQRFKLEISHGMTARVSTLKAYNRNYGTAFKRKAQALEDVEIRINELKSEMGITYES